MSARRWRAGAVSLGLLAVLSCQDPAYNLALSALFLPCVACSASGRRALRKRVYGLAPLLLGLGLSSALLAAIGGPSPERWTEQVARLAARVLAASLLLSWLTHDLRPAQLHAGLVRLRLPRALVELIMETGAYGRQLRETLHAAWAACVLRAGTSSIGALRQTIGAVAGIVVLRSIDRSERVAIASALRAGDSSLALDAPGAQTHARAAQVAPERS